MVAGKIGEDTAGKPQSADALLGDGMRRALHESVFATRLYHAAEQGIEFDGVGRGMLGGDGLVFYVVADRRQQATLVSHLAEHII